MNNSLLSVPGQKNYEYGYKLAYKIASQKLADTEGIERLCRNSGAEHKIIDSRPVITLDYLNQSYQISLPEVDISLAGSDEEVPLKDKILLLHYLTQAKGTPLANKSIAYKELPDGVGYFRTFRKRAIKPLVDNFSGQPEKLLEAAKGLGGVKADYGDAAVTINAFKQVPITFVLWKGDEEFSPSAKVLFDSSACHYLPTDLCAFLGSTLTRKLIEAT